MLLGQPWTCLLYLFCSLLLLLYCCCLGSLGLACCIIFVAGFCLHAIAACCLLSYCSLLFVVFYTLPMLPCFCDAVCCFVLGSLTCIFVSFLVNKERQLSCDLQLGNGLWWKTNKNSDSELQNPNDELIFAWIFQCLLFANFFFFFFCYMSKRKLGGKGMVERWRKSNGEELGRVAWRWSKRNLKNQYFLSL